MLNTRVLSLTVFCLLVVFIHAGEVFSALRKISASSQKLIAGSPFNATQTLNKLLDGYDKRLRPNYGGPAVEVGITMYVIRMTDLNTKTQMVTTDSYFRETWTDPRLAFSAPDDAQTLVLGPGDIKDFWQPDTFLASGTAKFAHDTNTFFRINKDGTILKSVRVLATTSIPMDLRYFPQDKQTMSLEFESYGYSARDIVYKWAKGEASIGFSPECASTEMQLTGYRILTESIALSTGNYSRVAVEADLTRVSGFYCRHFYLPAIISFLLVLTTFWFPVAYPAVRILLVLAALLTNILLMNKAGRHVPTLPYSTMLEKYISFCLVMAALSVLPLATVVYLHGKAQKVNVTLGGDLESSLLNGETKASSKETESDKENKGISSYFSRSAQYVMTIRQHRRSYKKLDILFRFLYPTVFIIFNIWYWVAFP